MAKDALTAHARDELGVSNITTPRPAQSALTSALTLSVGAAMPPAHAGRVARERACSHRVRGVFGRSRSSGCDRPRVTFWGALAMALTAGIGKLFGMVV